MKKLTKILALALAVAMMLGMTAFAVTPATEVYYDLDLSAKSDIINLGLSDLAKDFVPEKRKDDKIEIFVEKNEEGQIQNCAELKWLAYVNTEFAKKNLIKYFERKMTI